MPFPKSIADHSDEFGMERRAGGQHRKIVLRHEIDQHLPAAVIQVWILSLDSYQP